MKMKDTIEGTYHSLLRTLRTGRTCVLKPLTRQRDIPLLRTRKSVAPEEKYKNIAELGYLNYFKYFDNNNKFFFKKYFEKIINDIKN